MSSVCVISSFPASNQLQSQVPHRGLPEEQHTEPGPTQPEGHVDTQGFDTGLRQTQEVKEEQQKSQRTERSTEEGHEGLPDQARGPEVGHNLS